MKLHNILGKSEATDKFVGEVECEFVDLEARLTDLFIDSYGLYGEEHEAIVEEFVGEINSILTLAINTLTEMVEYNELWEPVDDRDDSKEYPYY